MKFFYLFLMLLCGFAYAEDEDSVKKQLSETINQIKSTDQTSKELNEKNEKIAKELKSLQEEMVKIAKNAGMKEEELSDFEDKLAILEAQKADKQKDFAKRQAELSSMISAMIRLKQMPPEAVIAMPNKLDETLATARALGVVTEAIEEEASSLKLQLSELDDLQAKIIKNRQDILSKKLGLEGEQTELLKRIDERSKLQKEIGGKAQKEREKLANLIARSKDLQELVDKLEQENLNQEQDIKSNSVGKDDDRIKRKLHSFAAAKGHISAPLKGKVVANYGTSKEDAFSKGIVISGAEKAIVVAPFDGEIVYAGNFRDYGKMVIIRHSDDYHTLLSGMEHINCTPGQFVIKGEPIGNMGKTPAHIYMELRKNGKPTNPSSWLG